VGPGTIENATDHAHGRPTSSDWFVLSGGLSAGSVAPVQEVSALALQRHDEGWQTKAACRGPLGAIFFPPTSGERSSDRSGREAKAVEVCRTCAVAEPCLAYALRIREPHGVWGGLNEAQRKALLAERAG
jgi:WhiB family transcriptional regulator, redox-sensing transcriptional regulator